MKICRSRSVIGVGLALALLGLPAFAQPICGRKDCREEIAACVEAQCEGLRGAERARCRRDCVHAVRAACDQDSEVCHPAVTTSTQATTSSSTSSTSTTLMGSPSGGFVD